MFQRLAFGRRQLGRHASIARTGHERAVETLKHKAEEGPFKKTAGST